MVPAFEIVGTLLTIIVTFETDAAQGLLKIVQAKTFVPKPMPVIVVFGNNELVIIPEPEINDHVPTPTVAVFAAIRALVPIHKV